MESQWSRIKTSVDYGYGLSSPKEELTSVMDGSSWGTLGMLSQSVLGVDYIASKRSLGMLLRSN